VVYPLGRFLLEFLRLDSAQIAGINANQTFMAIIGILAVITLFWRHRPGQKSRIDSMPDPIPTELESNE
jgi:phosphatidylglycerol:prolipoprotein diacylglycerol transferase